MECSSDLAAGKGRVCLAPAFPWCFLLWGLSQPALPAGVDPWEDGQGSAGAVRGEPPCFAEKTGVCLKLVALFKSLYKKGWLLTTSTLKLDIKEGEIREEISESFKVAEPGMAATYPDFQFPVCSLPRALVKTAPPALVRRNSTE